MWCRDPLPTRTTPGFIFAKILTRPTPGATIPAGAVLVKLNTLDGQARAFQRTFDLGTGDRVWAELAAGAEPEVDAAIGRQRGFDPDLWVIEVEDRQGRYLLGEPGLG